MAWQSEKKRQKTEGDDQHDPRMVERKTTASQIRQRWMTAEAGQHVAVWAIATHIVECVGNSTRQKLLEKQLKQMEKNLQK